MSIKTYGGQCWIGTIGYVNTRMATTLIHLQWPAPHQRMTAKVDLC